LKDVQLTHSQATSFKNTTLDSYSVQRLRKLHYEASLPILDTTVESMYDDFTIPKKLFLEQGSMRKQSYVRLDHTYEVPYTMLAQYSCNRAYKTRLSKVSYRTLMEELGFVPEQFEKATLVEISPDRLSAMANAAKHHQSVVHPPNAAEMPQRFVFPPIYQPSPDPVSQPPLPRYSALSLPQAPRYVPPSSSDRLPYSTSPEPSDPVSALLLLRCVFVVVGGSVGLVVWWGVSKFRSGGNFF
jgi:hypothetical protein